MCLSLDCVSVYVIVFRLCVSVCDCLCVSVYVIVFRLCVSVCVIVGRFCISLCDFKFVCGHV